jgi:N-carbamoylputrescine amidase
MTIAIDKATIGLIQMRCDHSAAANLDRAIRRIEEAAAAGAQVICLQELFLTPYFCQSQDTRFFDLAEPAPGPTTERLGQTAKRLGVVIIGSIFERRAAGVYHNTAVVLDADGAYLGMYRKMHIPDDPLYFEKYYFTPGDLGFRTFDTRFGRIGVLVCWDQWFPEGARLTALQGAQILFYPTAIGWHPREKAQFGDRQYQAWQTMQRAHAIANGLYVAAVNRVGHEGAADGGLEFWGGSFVAGPFGEIMAQAAHVGEQNLIVGCSYREAEDVRRNWPFLRDRRIDAYEGMTKRFLDGG